MVGSVTNGTTAGASMSGMKTGVVVDGTKVGYRRMTLPQPHFRFVQTHDVPMFVLACARTTYQSPNKQRVFTCEA